MVMGPPPPCERYSARARRRTPPSIPAAPAAAAAALLALLLPLAVAVNECVAAPPGATRQQQEQPHHRRFPELYTYEIVAEYPHDPSAFTQGAFGFVRFSKTTAPPAVLTALADGRSTRAHFSSPKKGPLNKQTKGLEYGVLCDDESNGNFTIREWYEPDDAPPSTASRAPSSPWAAGGAAGAAAGAGRCREVLWESTGLYGRSQVRVVDLLTGAPIASSSLGQEWFGEGLARVGDELLQLTWQGPQGFRWGARPRPAPGGGGGGGPGPSGERVGLRVAPIGSFKTPLQDGWGAAVDTTDYGAAAAAGDAQQQARREDAAAAKEGDGARPPPRPPLVVLSDGSDRLTWVHPGNLSVARHVDVRDPANGGAPVRHLNELEVVDGRVWANVWMTDCVAAIDGATGRVDAWVLLHGLRRALSGRRDVPGTAEMDVLNGIAWDRRRRRLFVTGKLWPRLYEVRVAPIADPAERLEAARHMLPSCFVDA